MSETEKVLEKLVKLSNEIGVEHRRWAILGEGNTSARLNEEQFYVKASGSSLGSAGIGDFTAVYLESVLNYLEKDKLDDEAVQLALDSIKVSPEAKRPSVETFVHAVCLKEGLCSWVGHCHAESVLAVLCSKLGAKAFQKHIFPDVIVVCGRHIAVVPYIDPGFHLALSVRQVLKDFRASHHNKAPKVVLLENHGPFILGQSDIDVFNTMQMLDKWARILMANQALGGARFLSDEDADRIDARIDEAYRRKRLLEQNKE
ncbi:MAG: class II aldolase/adducin family protein [Verrucomicrobiota bacterium]